MKPLEEYTNEEVLRALLSEGNLHKQWRYRSLFLLGLLTAKFLVTWWAYGNPMYPAIVIAGLCNWCFWSER